MPDPSGLLKINEVDRSATIPLVGPAAAERGVTEVKLEQPGSLVLIEFDEAVRAADQAMPPMPVLRRGEDGRVEASDEEVAAFESVARERRAAIYGPGAPYLAVIVKLTHALGHDDITEADLPGWCCNPRTCSALLNLWWDPLGGQDVATTVM